MANPQPLINGKAYSMISCVLEWKGLNIEFVDIAYKEKRNKTNNYTNSAYATSRSYGKIENVANSITMSLQQVTKLQDIAPIRGALHSIPPSPLRITYGEEGEPTHTDVINAFEFTETGVEGSIEDDFLVTTYETIFSHIS